MMIIIALLHDNAALAFGFFEFDLLGLLWLWLRGVGRAHLHLHGLWRELLAHLAVLLEQLRGPRALHRHRLLPHQRALLRGAVRRVLQRRLAEVGVRNPDLTPRYCRVTQNVLSLFTQLPVRHERVLMAVRTAKEKEENKN